MKTSMKSIVISGFIAASLLMASSCQKDDMNAENAQYASILTVSGDGATSVIEANLKSAMISTSDLTESEIASLLKMKEEEKLARDVYSVLAQKWGSLVFTNISKSWSCMSTCPMSATTESTIDIAPPRLNGERLNRLFN